MNLTQLRRLRLVVLAVVLAGVGSSVAMNVLHAPDNLAARFVGALPPLAVFGCIELVIRIPSSSRALSATRIFGAAVVAIGAATLSYAQQYAAIVDLDFPHWQAIIWPGVIDGTMIVATLSLVEVASRIRQLDTELVHVPQPPAAAPASPGMPPVHAEAPEVLAYRRAAQELRRTSRLPTLNATE